MKSLAEIQPELVSSFVQRNSLAESVGMAVGAAILVAAFVLEADFLWLWIVLALTAAGASGYGIHKFQDHLRAVAATTAPAAFPPPLSQAEIAAQITVWPSLFGDAGVKAWVLFSYGTCVVLFDSVADTRETARELLKVFGPALPGTNSADMLVYALESGDFVIGGHHPQILTYLPQTALSSLAVSDRSNTRIAFLGRDLRVFDAFSLQIVHWEAAAT